MRTTKEWREEQREALREGGWVNRATTDCPAVVDVDFSDQADTLHALLDDADAAEALSAEVARLNAANDRLARACQSSALDATDELRVWAALTEAAGLPASATPAEVVARVGEMREALVALGSRGQRGTTDELEAWTLARRLASEAGR
jgi:hypothetical protein